MTRASAPGKVILFGEHAVVYGRAAIAVPVRQVAASAEVTDLAGAEAGSVRIEAPDIGLAAWLRDLPGDDPLALIVRLTLAEIQVALPPALRVRVSSTIPIAAGLGSGAAVSVAVVRALSQHFGRPLPQERQSALAFTVEQRHHGTPSGIDNTVVTYAGPIYYRRGQAPRPFAIAAPFTLVIADTGCPAPTATAVAGVRRLWQSDRAATEAVFDAIDHIVEQARGAIEAGRPEALGGLMDQNQAWLERLGVSSAELQTLIAAARRAGAGGAKLSGAGLGGNMIALVTPQLTEPVAAALRAAGASRTLTTEVAG